MKAKQDTQEQTSISDRNLSCVMVHGRAGLNLTEPEQNVYIAKGDVWLSGD